MVFGPDLVPELDLDLDLHMERVFLPEDLSLLLSGRIVYGFFSFLLFVRSWWSRGFYLCFKTVDFCNNDTITRVGL